MKDETVFSESYNIVKPLFLSFKLVNNISFVTMFKIKNEYSHGRNKHRLRM